MLYSIALEIVLYQCDGCIHPGPDVLKYGKRRASGGHSVATSGGTVSRSE